MDTHYSRVVVDVYVPADFSTELEIVQKELQHDCKTSLGAELHRE